MKKIGLIIALSFSYFFSLNAQKEQLDQLFDRYQDTEGVTSIKIAKPMFGMLSKLDIQDSELDQIKPLLNKIQGLKILIVEKPDEESDHPEAFYTGLGKEILSSVNRLNYQELMTVNSKGSKIKFLSSDAKNGILDNLLLNINSEGNTILMMLDGKISMDDVNNLINETQNTITTTTSTTTAFNSSESGSIVVGSEGGKNTTSELRKLQPFTEIEASVGVNVKFTQALTQKVKVETDAGMLPYITTKVEGGVLKVSIDGKGKRNLRIRKILVSIDAPHLKGIKASSGAVFSTVNTVKENSITVKSSSGAKIEASLRANTEINAESTSGATLKINADTSNLIFKGNSGSSSVFTGKSEKASFTVSSAASCNAQDLVSSIVEANATSGANIKVNATKSLDSKTSSGGSVRYEGTPSNIQSDNSSGGSTKTIN